MSTCIYGLQILFVLSEDPGLVSGTETQVFMTKWYKQGYSIWSPAAVSEGWRVSSRSAVNSLEEL